MGKYHSTPGMFRDFVEGSVWQDMRMDIEEAIELTQIGLESAESWEKSLRLQGDISTLRRMLEMPYVILDDLEEPARKESSLEEPGDIDNSDLREE
jgi:hypothetical protein